MIPNIDDPVLFYLFIFILICIIYSFNSKLGIIE